MSTPDSNWLPPPPPANPAARLSWRIRHSWWLLIPVFGVGCFSGAGFLYVGFRARRRAWWISGILYMLIGSASFVVVGEAPEQSTLSTVGVSVFLAIWIAGIVHAGLINSSWLRWRAGHTPWYAQASTMGRPTHTAASPPLPPVPPLPPGMQPHTASFYGSDPASSGWHAQQPASVAQPPGFAPPHAPIDVNAATAEEFARLPGFDLDRAFRTVAQRQARSGFGSLEEFAVAAGLPPHQFAPLRHQLTCIPPGRNSQRPSPGQTMQGRVVDV